MNGPMTGADSLAFRRQKVRDLMRRGWTEREMAREITHYRLGLIRGRR